jgi:hypothetical protein
MDPKLSGFINSVCMVVIAIVVLLAYFHGWG